MIRIDGYSELIPGIEKLDKKGEAARSSNEVIHNVF